MISDGGLAHLYVFCKGGYDEADGAVLLSIRPGGFLELAELIDLHPALGEHGFNLQLPSHGSNHGLQSADVHIGAALHLGDGCLVDAEQVGQMLLGQLSRFAKLIESHLRNHLLGLGIRAGPRFGRHFCFKFTKVSRHLTPFHERNITCKEYIVQAQKEAARFSLSKISFSVNYSGDDYLRDLHAVNNPITVSD